MSFLGVFSDICLCGLLGSVTENLFRLEPTSCTPQLFVQLQMSASRVPSHVLCSPVQMFVLQDCAGEKTLIGSKDVWKDSGIKEPLCEAMQCCFEA